MTEYHLPDELAERLPDWRDVPLLRHLAIRVVDVFPGKAVFDVVVDEPHLRSMGLLHGGVTATLLDSAMGMAARTKGDHDQHVVTVQLNVNFVRPAWKGERLVATAEVQHSGSKTAVVRAEIRTDEGVLVALGSGTFMFLPREADELPKHEDPPERKQPPA